MNRMLSALFTGIAMVLPVPSQAAEIDGATDLQLRCGVGYLLVADDPDMNNTADEAAMLRQLGEKLLTQADGVLAEKGVPESEREQIGMRYMAEIDAALTNNSELGFDPNQCTSLVAEAEAAALDAEIDKYMTCGAGFLAAAAVSQESGDAETAASLEALGDLLAGHGDDLMVEAGFDDEVRFQIGQMYGESVSAKIKAGEELDYDWDTCAALGT